MQSYGTEVNTPLKASVNKVVTIATATGSKNDFKMTSFAAIHLYSE